MTGAIACSVCGRETSFAVPDVTGAFVSIALRTALCSDCELLAEQKACDAKAVQERRAAADRQRRYLAAARIPKRWRGVNWSSVEVDDRRNAVWAAQRWARREIDGLILTGAEVGTGKTHIAAAAANARLQSDPLRWFNVVDLFRDLSAPFGSDELRRAETALQRGTLVLDDLDKTRPTPYAASVIYGVINKRWEEGQGLLVTMNSTLDELALRFPAHGDAIASRLADYCDSFVLTGPDRRLHKCASTAVSRATSSRQ